jgi:hypothetical protein
MFNTSRDITSTFERNIAAAITASLERCSGTPDFILAQYLANCLAAYNTAVDWHHDWSNSAKNQIADAPEVDGGEVSIRDAYQQAAIREAREKAYGEAQGRCDYIGAQLGKNAQGDTVSPKEDADPWARVTELLDSVDKAMTDAMREYGTPRFKVLQVQPCSRLGQTLSRLLGL